LLLLFQGNLAPESGPSKGEGQWLVERASKAEKLDGSIRVVPEGFSIPTTKEQEWV
jgi:hypothetical protein